jgi:hypothetical protein
MVSFFVMLFLFGGNISVYGQFNKKSSAYFKLRGGIGKTYDNYGLNLELTYKSFGTYMSAGYTEKKTGNNQVLPASINFGGGLRYYFSEEFGVLRSKIGLYAGWLDNYFRPDSLKEYKANVYGMALGIGFEFNKGPFLFDFDLLFNPHFGLFKPKNNPSYNTTVLSPTFALGYNLGSISLFNKGRSRKTGSRHKIENNKYYKVLAEKVLDKPDNGNPVIKGACGNITIYQQIYNTKYIFISIHTDSFDVSYKGTKIDLSKKNKGIRVLFTDIQGISDSICCVMHEQLADLNSPLFKNAFEAINGSLFIVANIKKVLPKHKEPYKLTLKITGLKMEDKDQTDIYFDEILIWNLWNKSFCE